MRLRDQPNPLMALLFSVLRPRTKRVISPKVFTLTSVSLMGFVVFEFVDFRHTVGVKTRHTYLRHCKLLIDHIECL